MTLAADTRRAVRRNPFVFEALRAGVLNYTAAARFLDVGDLDPVAAALRRYAEELPDHESDSHDARVTMQSGLGAVDMAEMESGTSDENEALLAVGGRALVPDLGSLTGVLATGEVDARALAHVLDRLAVERIDVTAAGVAGDGLLVVVGRRAGPDAVRVVEEALGGVVTTPTD
ncbi:hypothetical protein C448_13786 [Halococcus morrhuae DSM 1307]|uniref:Uncharacterized protein n=1 Tax=Halococcus morrhuae DSM 1307 TaxID=931277 RepID=M0M731_HALMO|nr:hypothetical protein [Halococcus morrhuae]EMA40424.1 hypothetical protein C448_13786 [Halococcus morrhuae DSM 1307]